MSKSELLLAVQETGMILQCTIAMPELQQNRLKGKSYFGRWEQTKKKDMAET